jgi:hypothetical protein
MDMIYTPATATDITQLWRKHGYVPPSELPEYQAKWDYYQSLPLRKNPAEAGQAPEGGVGDNTKCTRKMA